MIQKIIFLKEITPMKKFVRQLVFFILPTLSLWFLKNEVITCLLIVIILGINFYFFEYHRNEITWFVIGSIAGTVLEVGGDLFYKLQYWDKGSLFGIPLWLPLLWGYGFVFIRRIGNLIVSNDSK